MRKELGDDLKGRDAPTREPDLEIEHVKGASNEAQKSFMEVTIPSNRDPIKLGMDPFMLTTFLEICMKLLCDNRVVKGLQELITRCVGLGEPRGSLETRETCPVNGAGDVNDDTNR